MKEEQITELEIIRDEQALLLERLEKFVTALRDSQAPGQKEEDVAKVITDDIMAPFKNHEAVSQMCGLILPHKGDEDGD